MTSWTPAHGERRDAREHRLVAPDRRGLGRRPLLQRDILDHNQDRFAVVKRHDHTTPFILNNA
jgi:pimeloyl-ACP methyl ester carboxylesterase